MRRGDNLTNFLCRLSWNLGALSSWNPQGLSRPLIGLLYIYFFTSVYLSVHCIFWPRCCAVHMTDILEITCGFRLKKTPCSFRECSCPHLYVEGEKDHQRVLSLSPFRLNVATDLFFEKSWVSEAQDSRPSRKAVTYATILTSNSPNITWSTNNIFCPERSVLLAEWRARYVGPNWHNWFAPFMCCGQNFKFWPFDYLSRRRIFL